MLDEKIRLTQYSHGGGCGCKIAPQVLEQILKQDKAQAEFKDLLVGNSGRDDAAVYKINDEEAIIATTDFFTPIVDDPYIFGKVAAANAISDVYAMGGTPMMALAILGWPINKLPLEIANEVMEGARAVCAEAHIPLAGGHSIDTPEPIFGLSVNGRIAVRFLKENNKAQIGDYLLLTKPLGVGSLSTAAKRGIISEPDLDFMHNQLTRLNSIGEELSKLDVVHAMTDVTGFGLAGHMIEMAEGSGLSAELDFNKVPKIPGVEIYLQKNVFPDATYRNWSAYSEKIQIDSGVNTVEAFQILADPQTNGGLLISVSPDGLEEVQRLLKSHSYENFIEPIGRMTERGEKVVVVR